MKYCEVCKCPVKVTGHTTHSYQIDVDAILPSEDQAFNQIDKYLPFEKGHVPGYAARCVTRWLRDFVRAKLGSEGK